MATARSASSAGSATTLAETLAERRPTKARSVKSSPSDAAGLLDLAEADLDGERDAAHADRVGGIGAGALRRLDEAGGAVGQVGLVEDCGHGSGLRKALIYGR